MPASSSSSSFGWAAYIAAALVLCATATPSLSALSSGSRIGAAARTVAGIASVVDELKPGLSATVSYSNVVGSSDVRFEGNFISVSAGNATIAQEVIWLLPNVTLAPGEPYTLKLAGGMLKVIPDG